jgi:LAO/AO transport system kinase
MSRRHPKSYEDLLERFRRGETLAASRLMSIVERRGDEAEEILDRLFPDVGRAHRIGVTGGTGGGKSTLVNALTRIFRAAGNTVGVVAEDPTSPFSGGAILGDRIRMTHAVGDEGVFVRSVASRGSETGFSVLAGELSDVLDAFGRDVILLETTGVGQLETGIRFVADTTVVVFTPEAGDEVQSLKSGLMEIGDVFAVNKADRPHADRFAKHLRSTLEMRYGGGDWTPPVVKTAAHDETGVDALSEAVSRHRSYLSSDGRLAVRRREGLERRIRAIATEKAAGLFWGNPYIRARFDGIFEEVAAGALSPYAAARRLAGAIRIDESS